MSAGDYGLEAFLETLPTLRDADGGPFFAPGGPLSVARAPGRLDVMGGIGDYSGSLVLQMPIRAGAFAAVQVRTSTAVELMSLGHAGTATRIAVRDDVTHVQPYCDGRELPTHSSERWAGYVLGAFTVLARERGASFTTGARVCIASSVPEGRGVASSAAIEVSAMSAIADAYGLTVGAPEIAALCHLLENEVVGVPCGPMDQLAVALGEDSRLLALLCRPAQVLGSVDFPDGLVAIGVDSGASHSNAGGAYRRARTAAFMGKHIVEQDHGPLDYLTELEPASLRAYDDRLPVTLSGDDFLRRYGDLDDRASLVEREDGYRVRAAVDHAIREHQRVREFADLLPRARSLADRERLGALMHLSHAGYRACGLGSAPTDAVAETLARIPGVYGARVTGGGCGGTVAALVDSETVPRVAEAARGRGWRLVAGSSPGADRFGVRRLSAPR
ncbi:MAG: galactokinase [Gaiellaceae bacterium]